MPSISQKVIEHTLSIKHGSKLVKQGLRYINQDKCKAICEELARILAAGFIKEVQCPNWIGNLFLVQKRIRNGGCVLTTQA
jgi:hypothetical protein